MVRGEGENGYMYFDTFDPSAFDIPHSLILNLREESWIARAKMMDRLLEEYKNRRRKIKMRNMEIETKL